MSIKVVQRKRGEVQTLFQGCNLGAGYSHRFVQQQYFHNFQKVDSLKLTQLLERRKLWF